LQVLKGMSSLVNDISRIGSQMQLWAEPLPPQIDFYNDRATSSTGVSAASVANRAASLVLAFRPCKSVLHSDSMVFGEDFRGLLNERGSAPGLHNWTVNQSNPDFVHRSPDTSLQEVTDAIFLVRDTHQSVMREVKPDDR
jgi:hypothetical protein